MDDLVLGDDHTCPALPQLQYFLVCPVSRNCANTPDTQHNNSTSAIPTIHHPTLHHTSTSTSHMTTPCCSHRRCSSPISFSNFQIHTCQTAAAPATRLKSRPRSNITSPHWLATSCISNLHISLHQHTHSAQLAAPPPHTSTSPQ